MPWIAALERSLSNLHTRGWVTIHRHVAAPVDPGEVAEALARAPDLDADILEFYARSDGAQIVVGRPLRELARYRTVELARQRAERHAGALVGPDELYQDVIIGPAVSEEFGAQVRSVEIVSFTELMDPRSGRFEHREGDTVIHLAAWLDGSECFGMTRAEEIRRWRQPLRRSGQTFTRGRAGYRDHDADFYQARLREREQEPGPRRAWWVVRGEDHGAALARAPLLGWSQMLQGCWDHLEREG